MLAWLCVAPVLGLCRESVEEELPDHEACDEDSWLMPSLLMMRPKPCPGDPLPPMRDGGTIRWPDESRGIVPDCESSEGARDKGAGVMETGDGAAVACSLARARSRASAHCCASRSDSAAKACTAPCDMTSNADRLFEASLTPSICDSDTDVCGMASACFCTTQRGPAVSFKQHVCAQGVPARPGGGAL